MPKWYRISAKDDSQPAEIDIFDEIGFWGVTAKDLIADLRAIKSGAITLSINSPGGNVFDALAIYNALRQHAASVTVRVMGVAASAASLIAMAGDTIIMPENSFMMVHNPLGAVYGNAEDLRDLAETLDKIGAALVATYVARTGQTEEKINELLAAETWLSAADAVELGFADKIEAALKIAASYDMDRLPDNVKAAFDAETVTLPAETSLTARIVAACAAAGMAQYATNFALDPAIADDAGIEAALSEAHEIIQICALAKQPAHADAYIQARTALADVRRSLADARAAADEALQTDGHIPSATHTKPAPSEPQAVTTSAIWSARNASSQHRH